MGKRIERVVRWINWKPTTRSSSATCWLTAALLSFRRCAASVKLPSWAITPSRWMCAQGPEDEELSTQSIVRLAEQCYQPKPIGKRHAAA